MKKHLLVLFLLVGAYGTTFSQAEIGQIIVGGGIGISSEKSKTKTTDATIESDPNVNLNFSPRVGYFLAEDMEVGLSLIFDKNSMGPSDGRTTYTATSFAPYIRKYFGLGETVFLFGEGTIQFGSGKVKTETAGTTTKTDDYSIFALGVSPGIMFKPSEKVGFEFTAGFLGYQNYTDKNPGGGAEEISTNSFGFDFSLRSVNLGVVVFL